MTDDKRHEPRVKNIDFISVTEFHPETFRTSVTLGQTGDLSHDGLRVELSHPIPFRAEVALSLAVGARIVDLKGRVCSLQEVDESTCSMGIQFTDVPSESRQAIDDYLAKLS